MSSTVKMRAKSDNERQCRACLTKIDGYSFVNIFIPLVQFDPKWSSVGLCIADGLTRLTNIQITETDPYPKIICLECYSCLKDVFNFIWSVVKSDTILRQKYNNSKVDTPSWPKPIQIDKNILSNAFENEMQVEIKQEVMTEDENEMSQTVEPCEPRLDIKIEPEEMTPAQIEMELNDVIHDPDSDDNTPNTNSSTEYLDECVKDEPMSDDEIDTSTDLGKECMLCMKAFSTFKGLKAHVIAIHSYDSVTSRPVERTNVCATCNRSFATRTDLYVHETCHGKFVCYVCDMKFDTFSVLIKHRSKCKKDASTLPRLKTLEDVRRPIYYIIDKVSKPQEDPPTKHQNLESCDQPDSVPTSDDISKDTTSREQETKNTEASKIPQESDNTSQVETVIENNSGPNEFKSKIRLKNINDLQVADCKNGEAVDFDGDIKIEDSQKIEQLESKINAKGNEPPQESDNTSLIEAVEKTNSGLNQPAFQSTIKLKNISDLKETKCTNKDIVDFNVDNRIKDSTQPPNIKQLKSESNAKKEGTKIPQESDFNSPVETVKDTKIGTNELAFLQSNIRLKNINELQDPNCTNEYTIDFDVDGNREDSSQLQKIRLINNIKQSEASNETENNQPPHRQTTCANDVSNYKELTESNTTSDHITKAQNSTYCEDNDTVRTENNKTEESKSICNIESQQNKSPNGDSIETESFDKAVESSNNYLNTDKNGTEINKRKPLETCSNNNNEMDSEQTGVDQSEEPEALKNCQLPDPKNRNIESHSISNEDNELNTHQSKLGESMEVQLEIHSIKKDEDVMEVDAELDSDIKMDSSESSSTQ